jgi:hypothetical protein
MATEVTLVLQHSEWLSRCQIKISYLCEVRKNIIKITRRYLRRKQNAVCVDHVSPSVS